MAGADGNAAQKCPLCESTLEAGTIFKTRCGHVFHQACIAGYSKNKTTFPI